MFRRLLTMCLAGALAFAAVSCSDDNDEKIIDKDKEITNVITLENESIEIKNSLNQVDKTGYPDADGNFFYPHVLMLFGDGFNVTAEGAEGEGDILTLYLGSSGEEIEEGIYTLSGFADTYSVDGVFQIASAYLELNIKNGEAEATHAFDQATLEVSRVGESYKFILTAKTYPFVDARDWTKGLDKSKPARDVKAVYVGAPARIEYDTQRGGDALFGDEAFELSDLVIHLGKEERTGEDDTKYYRHVLNLATPGYTFVPGRGLDKGKGNMFVIVFNGETDELVPGTYSFTFPGEAKPNQVDMGILRMGYDADVPMTADSHDAYTFDEGTIAISKNDHTYSVQLTGIVYPMNHKHALEPPDKTKPAAEISAKYTGRAYIVENWW